MNEHQNIRLERLPETLARYSLPKSTFYARISEGVIPPPVSLGGRAVAWVEHETNQVLEAMVAGYSVVELQELVRELLVKRERARE